MSDNFISWLTKQTQAARAGLSAEKPKLPRRFNPHPPGVIREGSATSAVLKLLNDHPKRSWCHYEIIEATGRTRVAVGWALIFLRSQGLIECLPDAHRNSRYLRYRAIGGDQ